MGILQLLHHRDVIELDIEVLVDRFQGPTYLDVVLELDGDFMVDQRLEEAARRQTLALVKRTRGAERGRGVIWITQT